jgi:hypothetical protein
VVDIPVGNDLVRRCSNGHPHKKKVRIGVMATLKGALTTPGEDDVRGAQVALKQAGGKLLGKEVERGKVSIIVGPLSGSEGILIRDYSKAKPNVTFVNGSYGAGETTCVTPSPSGGGQLKPRAPRMTVPAKMRRLDIGGLGFDRQPS